MGDWRASCGPSSPLALQRPLPRGPPTPSVVVPPKNGLSGLSTARVRLIGPVGNSRGYSCRHIFHNWMGAPSRSTLEDLQRRSSPPALAPVPWILRDKRVCLLVSRAHLTPASFATPSVNLSARRGPDRHRLRIPPMLTPAVLVDHEGPMCSLRGRFSPPTPPVR